MRCAARAKNLSKKKKERKKISASRTSRSNSRTLQKTQLRTACCELKDRMAQALQITTQDIPVRTAPETTGAVHKTIPKSETHTFQAGDRIDVEDNGNEWHEVVDHEMGTTSYFNWNTGVTQWNKPGKKAILESSHSNSEGRGSQNDRALSICTIELTPAEALTVSQLSEVYDSITATPGIGGVVSWLGYETVPFAFGLNLMVIRCAVDGSGGSGCVACGELEALPAAQAVRLLDVQRLSIVSYGDTDYWDQRYGDENVASYDWLIEWKQVRRVIQAFVGYTDCILQAGIDIDTGPSAVASHIICFYTYSFALPM
jgi:hypothetical protein